MVVVGQRVEAGAAEGGAEGLGGGAGEEHPAGAARIEDLAEHGSAAAVRHPLGGESRSPRG
ncbi:hypothetical protein [Kitasatospora putterlickiae]|uniref:hypothetical protein n=1 Tax=Kitasatospora putterlickiae TaxID=221725 RepID=UPI0031D635E2